jgi:hypothetical protein
MYCKDCKFWKRCGNKPLGACSKLVYVDSDILREESGPFFENLLGGLSVNLGDGDFIATNECVDIKILARWLNKALEKLNDKTPE